MERTKAMVLSGGRGARMGCLCDVRPKPTLPFAGGFRVIDFSLSNCIHSGIENIAVLTDYQRERMDGYLKRWRAMNSDPSNFEILSPRNGSYKGTADAVYQNLDSLARENIDRALILAGDHVYKMDYRQMLDFHQKSGADVTIGVVTVPASQAFRFGMVSADGSGRITDFVEKPKDSQSTLASMGIYLFNRQTLADYLKNDADRNDSAHDFGHNVAPRLVKNQKVFAYKFNGYWQDIGTVEAYYQANIELTSEQPSFNMDGSWPIFSEISGLSREKLTQGEVINSYISPRCVIKGRVENSILSPGVFVGERAVVRNSVLMADTSVEYHSVVDSAILDEGTRIGKFCYVGFGAALGPVGGEITVLGKDVMVPSYTAIGKNCQILPNAQPRDFETNAIPRCYHFPWAASSPNQVIV